MIADTWLRGLRDFDTDAAYKAMLKSADTPGKDNFLRTDNDDYTALGYVPLRETFDKLGISCSRIFIFADFALSQFAQALGNDEECKAVCQTFL